MSIFNRRSKKPGGGFDTQSAIPRQGHPSDTFPTIAQPLSPQHLEGATIVPSRQHLLPLLSSGIHFTEVGVALGGFTDAVLAGCDVAHYTAIDMFDLHQWPHTWDGLVGRTLGSMSHLEYWEKKYSNLISIGKMTPLVGDSHQSLNLIPDASQDVIYLDSDHSYPHIKGELEIAIKKVKPGGFLILNDYIMFDHLRGVPYGVVQAAHEFLIKHDWKITHLALHPQMFCDIMIRKR